METRKVKSEIVRLVQELPENAAVEDAMEQLYFLAKIERALVQSEAADTISHEDIKTRFLRGPLSVGLPKLPMISMLFTTLSHETRPTTQS